VRRERDHGIERSCQGEGNSLKKGQEKEVGSRKREILLGGKKIP
jgi:hypothetical protein